VRSHRGRPSGDPGDVTCSAAAVNLVDGINSHNDVNDACRLRVANDVMIDDA
jgi:hypothetical protein